MALRNEGKHITLSVKDLIPSESAINTSSFPLAQRGALGKQAQSWVQKQRKISLGMFHAEYSISHTFTYRDYTFSIKGRIDGVFKIEARYEIEEIKSVILKASEFKHINENSYPAFNEQLLFYAYLLHKAEQNCEIICYLIIVNLVDHKQKILPLSFTPQKIERLLFKRFDALIDRIETQNVRLAQRKKELKDFSYALPEQRPQQQQMISATTHALEQNRHLLISAPTGTGKTAASLYPALSYALAHNKSIIFATSKTSQQHIVAQTLSYIKTQPITFSAVFIRAAEKMCANDIFFCHEAYCPFIQDYKARIANTNIVETLLKDKVVEPDTIFKLAEKEQLCPFEVSLDVSFKADIVVGDYNYIFDPAVQLRRLFLFREPADWVLIIDEAHNLYERGRSYLSGLLKRTETRLLLESVKSQKNSVYKQLSKGIDTVLKLLNNLQLQGEAEFGSMQYFETDPDSRVWSDAFNLYESAYINYLIYKVRKAILIMDDPLEAFYYNLRRFVQLTQYKEAAFVPYYNAEQGGIFQITCCDPAEYLGSIINRFHSTLAMSATLDPVSYYEEVLGFDKQRTQQLQLSSPFSAEKRKLIIVPNISTKYKDRMNSYAPIAEIISRSVKERLGNYLVFFPSYSYLESVALFLRCEDFEVIHQQPGMDDIKREEILHQLTSSKKPIILLAVMGGVFSEGVDFYGEMAIGVFVISPALPQVNYERALLQRYYAEKNGLGLEYAYYYPGMNKVIQAVGRLIRSKSDYGIIMLIGQRFAEEEFNALLPDYWFEKMGDVEITSNYLLPLNRFWSKFVQSPS